MVSSWPPPPQSTVPSIDSGDDQSSVSSLQNVNSSIIIIFLVLSITVFVSVSLCFLLRYIRRRRLLRRHRSHSHRVSPEIDGAAVGNGIPSGTESLPVFSFSSVKRRQSTTESGDCAVCLSRFEATDQLRLLPLCCHAFHAECIDIWLQANETCPLCRSSIHASEPDVKALLQTSAAAGGGGGSFRLEIGSVSRRQQTEPDSENPPPQNQNARSFSIGSFHYIVENDSEIIVSQTFHRNVSVKETARTDPIPAPALLEDVGERGWLKDYADRLSASFSSRSLSFHSSGRFFTGSSRRTEIEATRELDLEANRIGEEISEMFRWFSGV